MKCPVCHDNNPEGAVICRSCGTIFKSNENKNANTNAGGELSPSPYSAEDGGAAPGYHGVPGEEEVAEEIVDVMTFDDPVVAEAIEEETPKEVIWKFREFISVFDGFFRMDIEFAAGRVDVKKITDSAARKYFEGVEEIWKTKGIKKEEIKMKKVGVAIKYLVEQIRNKEIIVPATKKDHEIVYGEIARIAPRAGKEFVEKHLEEIKKDFEVFSELLRCLTT